MANAYEVTAPDFDLSPYTGMTRQHYIDLAKYLLGRAFKHVAFDGHADLISDRAGQDVSAAR